MLTSRTEPLSSLWFGGWRKESLGGPTLLTELGCVSGLPCCPRLVLGHWLGYQNHYARNLVLNVTCSLSKRGEVHTGQDQLLRESGTGQRCLGPGFSCDKMVPVPCGHELAWDRSRGKWTLRLLGSFSCIPPSNPPPQANKYFPFCVNFHSS